MEYDDRDSFSSQPIYNIGVVERMTGVPVATLRAWERRYDFPSPDRTPGGHRVYSEEEVVRLQWVKARVDEGMQISQAVEALRLLEQKGQFPPPPPPLLTQLDVPTLSTATEPTLQLFQDRLTEALLSQDTAEADEVLRRVLALYPLEDLIFQLIQPTLAQVGEAWQEGRISIAAEHMATHYLRHRLVTWLYTGPPTLPVPPTVLACAPGEWHEGSLLMLGILLRRRRWPVVYLGQSLPLPDLASFVKGLRPAAVVLVAMMEETARALEGWPRWLPNVKPRDAPLVAFGGRVFTVKPEWRERVPGLFLGETLAEGVERLERALRRRYPDG